jgi:hypothetical protein
MKKLKPGVVVQHLSQSVTNQVPRDARAIARQVEDVNLQFIRQLRAGISS